MPLCVCPSPMTKWAFIKQNEWQVISLDFTQHSNGKCNEFVFAHICKQRQFIFSFLLRFIHFLMRETETKDRPSESAKVCEREKVIERGRERDRQTDRQTKNEREEVKYIEININI